MQRGYKEHFCFYEIFWLSCQILDFTLWTKSTVVEFSKGQIDGIFLRSVLRPQLVYLSFGIPHIPVSIHEGSTPSLPNRGRHRDSVWWLLKNFIIFFNTWSSKLIKFCSDPVVMSKNAHANSISFLKLKGGSIVDSN